MQTYSCTCSRYICMHTDAYTQTEEDRSFRWETLLWKVLITFQVICYFEVDLSRPFPYNELPEEDHKAFNQYKLHFYKKEN